MAKNFNMLFTCIVHNMFLLIFAKISFTGDMGILYLVFKTVIEDTIQTAWLNKRNLLFSHLGGWKFENQDVSRFGPGGFDNLFIFLS